MVATKLCVVETDGSVLLYAGGPKGYCIYDLTKDKESLLFRREVYCGISDMLVLQAQFDEDARIVLVLTEYIIEIYDVKTNVRLARLSDEKYPFSVCKVSDYLITAGTDGTLTLRSLHDYSITTRYALEAHIQTVHGSSCRLAIQTNQQIFIFNLDIFFSAKFQIRYVTTSLQQKELP
eukprot:UN30123